MTAAVTAVTHLLFLVVVIHLASQQALQLPQLLAIVVCPSTSTAAAAPTCAANTHLDPGVPCESPPPSIGEPFFVLSTTLRQAEILQQGVLAGFVPTSFLLAGESLSIEPIRQQYPA